MPCFKRKYFGLSEAQLVAQEGEETVTGGVIGKGAGGIFLQGHHGYTPRLGHSDNVPECCANHGGAARLLSLHMVALESWV